MDKIFKKIRFNFILSSMVSMIIVVGLIMAAINYSNYSAIYNYADGFIEDLETNDGIQNKNESVRDLDLGVRDFKDFRYISVYVDEENNIISFNETMFFSPTSLVQLVNEAEESESGLVDFFRYQRIETSSGDMLVFVDVNREIEQFETFLYNSLQFSIVGLLAVFGLVLLLSRNIMKPIIESYQKQKEFITNASHELKTPLTVISANNELLEMDYGENDSIAEINNQVEKLTSLTNDLVTLSKLDEVYKEEMMKIDFPLSDIVDETVNSFEAIASAKGLIIEKDIEKNISYYGDEKSIRQLINILMDNAVKYADSRKPVKISLKKGKRVTLAVSNSCYEIGKGNHNELFDRFYQADKSRNSLVSKGYGIGLSLAEAIVNNSDGDIIAYSEDERSLTIEVTL